MSNDLEENTTMSPRHFTGNWPHVLNMANSIIGVSVLALPFCFKQCGILLGFLLLMGSAWLTRLTCHLLMKSAFATKKKSYEYLAFHIFGRAGKLLVELSIIGLLIGTCVAFYIIIGDLGPAVVSKVTGLENTPQLRSILLIILTGFVVLPLAMLHSLDSLSNFSAISLTFYCVFVAEVIIAAFPNLWSGVWVSKVVFWNTDGVFKCLPIFALCFACQTQLFMMSDALPEPSLNRINRIVHSAVIMCSVIYVSVGCFGYIAFCDDYISGDILMNFSPTFFSEAIKLGFVTSTLISFPLVIFPCRASLYTLLFVRKGLHDNFGGAVYIPPSYFKAITVSIIGVTLTIGVLVPNIEFMLAITGATMGSLICYILPAVLFISAISVDHGGNTRSFAQLVLLIGVTILLASSYVTLTGEDKVVKHESVVKLGQPIEHKEDNLPIHNDDDLKKKLDEMKEQLPPVHLMEQNANNPGDAVNKDVKDAVVAAAATAPPVIKVEIVGSTVLVADESKQVEAVEDKLPDKKDDKRQEPPNPHAPVDEVAVQQENVEDLKKGDDDAKNQSKEDVVKDKNQNPVEPSRASDLKQPPEKKLDEETSQATGGQQEALYARPALVEVLHPKVEGQPIPLGTKYVGNEKTGDLKENHDGQIRKVQTEKSEGAKLETQPLVEKIMSSDGIQLEGAQNNLMVKHLDLLKVPGERPVEMQHEPETKKQKTPTEQPAIQKNVHRIPKHAKTADVGDKVLGDQRPDVDQHEAKIIIAELKKQQQEQRKLLDEHRKIIDELKRHQIEVHQELPSQSSKGTDEAVGENEAGKDKPVPVQKKHEKLELPADGLGKGEGIGKAVSKVSSRVEHDKETKPVVEKSSKVVKEGHEKPSMDDSNTQRKENSKLDIVKTNMGKVERLANYNLIPHDSEGQVNEKSKIGDVKKKAVETEGHARENINVEDAAGQENKNNVVDEVEKKAVKAERHQNNDIQSQNFAGNVRIRNAENGIALKAEKLDSASKEKLLFSQRLQHPENDIPVFVSKKS